MPMWLGTKSADEAQAFFFQRVRESFEILARSEFGIQRVVIGNVVSVGAPGAARKNGEAYTWLIPSSCR